MHVDQKTNVLHIDLPLYETGHHLWFTQIHEKTLLSINALRFLLIAYEMYEILKEHSRCSTSETILSPGTLTDTL